MINRVNFNMREAIDRYLAKGWAIVGRDPLRLKRGRATMQVVNGVINCG